MSTSTYKAPNGEIRKSATMVYTHGVVGTRGDKVEVMVRWSQTSAAAFRAVDEFRRAGWTDVRAVPITEVPTLTDAQQAAYDLVQKNGHVSDGQDVRVTAFRKLHTLGLVELIEHGDGAWIAHYRGDAEPELVDQEQQATEAPTEQAAPASEPELVEAPLVDEDQAPAATVTTVRGTTPADADNPLVRAALDVLAGAPLAEVGATITLDTTGWYVRPAGIFGPGRQVTVRYVTRGQFRPRTAATGRRMRAQAARRFTRAGWAVIDGPPTVLIVEAPAEPTPGHRPDRANRRHPALAELLTL